jgi:hypothetical protein
MIRRSKVVVGRPAGSVQHWLVAHNTTVFNARVVASSGSPRRHDAFTYSKMDDPGDPQVVLLSWNWRRYYLEMPTMQMETTLMLAEEQGEKTLARLTELITTLAEAPFDWDLK